ncbi:MAG: hypothetical protein ACYCST_12225 [Acidimicrobiales bacterium]
MAGSLLHHDLIVLPCRPGAPSIYWLRLYSSDYDPVAIITEVPGNPGRSVTNDIETIASYVAESFRLDITKLVLFQIWPSGHRPSGYPIKPDVARVSLTSDGRERPPQIGQKNRKARRTILGTEFTGRPEWGDATRADIEALVGGPLPELPEHEELYRRVCSAGGGVVEDVTRRCFEVIPVNELPPPHCPARCGHYDRFEQLSEKYSDRDGLTFDAQLEIGNHFLEALTPKDLASCYFHRANWKAIADESVRIIETLGELSSDDYVAESVRSPLNPDDREWLASLFNDPVRVGDGSYSNGQHRGCALRFSGAERAAVVTGYETLGEECTDWTYLGGG